MWYTDAQRFSPGKVSQRRIAVEGRATTTTGHFAAHSLSGEPPPGRNLWQFLWDLMGFYWDPRGIAIDPYPYPYPNKIL